MRAVCRKVRARCQVAYRWQSTGEADRRQRAGVCTDYCCGARLAHVIFCYLYCNIWYSVCPNRRCTFLTHVGPEPDRRVELGLGDLPAPSSTPTDSPRCPSQRPPHPHRPHWRPPSRCTPHPRTPSLRSPHIHQITTLPPPTHRPTPPRRRLTAPIPPDSATGPALALPSLRRPIVPPPPFHAHPHRAVPPHRHLSRPLYAARPLAQ